MKLLLKSTVSLMLLSLPVTLTSCDSGSSDLIQQGDISQIPLEIANSLDQVVGGDVIVLTTTIGDNILPATPDEITATAPLEFIADDIVLTYRKIGTYDFSLTGTIDAQTIFLTALNDALGSPAEINVTLRALLLNLGSPPSRADLQSIIDILDPVGELLILHPDQDTILAAQDLEYFFRSESNNASLLIGEMSGIFNSSIVYYPIDFRQNVEGLPRLITPSHWIPFYDTSRSFTLEDTQQGIFNMSLTNTPSTLPPTL